MPKLRLKNPMLKIQLAWEFKEGTGRWPNVGELDNIDMSLRDDVLQVEAWANWAYEHEANVRAIRKANNLL